MERRGQRLGGVVRITWLANLLGIPCVLLAVGALVGVVVMLVRGK